MARMMPTKIPAMVAPITGMRSKRKTITASGPANGAPRIDKTMKAVRPAMVACSSAPPT